MSKVILLIFLLGLSSCLKSKISESEDPGLGSGKALINNDEKACLTPWGEKILSGETRKAYKKDKTANCTETCDSVSALLTCADGVLKNSDVYIYNTCDKPKCDCNIAFLDQPVTLKHGDYIKLYTKSTSECETCASAEVQRQCVDGVLTGDESARFQTCNFKACQDCALSATETLAHGASRDFYKTASGLNCDAALKCDASGIKQTRKCVNGSLTGDSSFSKLSCTNNFCQCKVGSTSIPHNGSVTYYKKNSAKCSDSFACQDASNKIISTCNDGVITGLTGTAYDSCTQETCACTYIDGAGTSYKINDGDSLAVYGNATPACGTSCTSVKGTVTCNKGVLTGNTNFKSKTCAEQTCDCSFKDTSGNTVTVTNGQSTSVYSEAAPACGMTCTPGTVTCNNTVLTGNTTYKAKSCLPKTCDCEFTDIDGVKSLITTVAPNNVMNVYQAKSVACGGTCAAATVTCTNTVLSGNTTYKAKSCSVANCVCATPWGVNVNATDSKTTPVSFYKQATSVCGQAKCAQLPDNKIDLYCIKNGATTYWVNSSDQIVSDFSVYKYSACTNPTCYCTVGGKNIEQNKAANYYKANSVTCGQLCETADNYISVTCNNDLTISTSPAGANADLFLKNNPTAYGSCQVGACPPGTTTTSPVVSDGAGDGQTGDGGGTGGGTGDGEGPGIGFKGRSGGGGGSGGPTNKITFFSREKLANQSGCSLPWGGVVTHGASVNAFTRATALTGHKCSEYKVLRKCLYGSLRGNTAATNMECQETP